MSTENSMNSTAITFQAYNIPQELQNLDNWAIYRSVGKIPFKAAAVYTGIRQYGQIEGNTAGASSVDPTHWAPFDVALQAFRIREDEGFVNGLCCALTEEMGIVVIDLDDPRKKRDRYNLDTPEAAAKFDKICEDTLAMQDQVKKAFVGTFGETSLSGSGTHIFIRGRLPHSRYNLGSFGSVFTEKQFIHMTGNLIPGASRDILPMQDVLDDFVSYFSGLGVLVPVDHMNDPKSENNIALLRDQSVTGGRRIDLDDMQVVQMLGQQSRQIYAAFMGDPSGGFPTKSGVFDWSEITNVQLIGALDKITGDAEQLRRVLLSSPRLRSAGTDSSGKDRFEKTERAFMGSLIRARQSNNRKFEADAHDPLKLAAAAMMAANNAGQIQWGTSQNSAPPPVATQPVILDQAEQEIKEAFAQTTDKKIKSKFTTDVSKLIARFEEIDPEFKVSLGLPPGVAGAMANELGQMLMTPRLTYVIPTLLVGLSGTVGRVAKMGPRKDGCNLLAMLAGQMHTGKSSAMSAWKYAVKTSIAGGYANPNDMTRIITNAENALHGKARIRETTAMTPQGMYDVLMDHGSVTMFGDDSEAAFRRMIDDRDSQGTAVKGAIKQLYDEANALGTYSTQSSRMSKNTGNAVPIPHPALSLLMSFTNEVLADITTKELEDGLLSRIIIVMDDAPVSDPWQEKDDCRLAFSYGVSDLIRRLNEEADAIDFRYILETSDGDKGRVEMSAAKMSEVAETLPHGRFTKDAREFLTAYGKVLHDVTKRAQTETDPTPNYYQIVTRSQRQVERIAAVLAYVNWRAQGQIPLLGSDGSWVGAYGDGHQFTWPIGKAETIWAASFVTYAQMTILSGYEMGVVSVGVGAEHSVVLDKMRAMMTGRRIAGSTEWEYVNVAELTDGARQRKPFISERRGEGYRAVQQVLASCMAKGIIIPQRIKLSDDKNVKDYVTPEWAHSFWKNDAKA